MPIKSEPKNESICKPNKSICKAKKKIKFCRF